MGRMRTTYGDSMAFIDAMRNARENRPQSKGTYDILRRDRENHALCIILNPILHETSIPGYLRGLSLEMDIVKVRLRGVTSVFERHLDENSAAGGFIKTWEIDEKGNRTEWASAQPTARIGQFVVIMRKGPLPKDFDRTGKEEVWEDPTIH